MTVPQPDVPRSSVRAAFFDVDNTLVQGSSLYLIGRGLLASKMVSRRDLVRYGLVQAQFRLRGENLSHLQDAQSKALSLGAGLVVDDVVALSRQLYQQRVAPRLWPQTLELTRRHLAAGHEVWLVSAAPVELVQIIADALGLTGGLGTRSEVAAGRWTGQLLSPILHGQAKAQAVQDLANLRSIDLLHSDAYSDSIHDVHLLTAVGHPHAVNPERRLAHLAHDNGWPVHQFRAGGHNTRRPQRLRLPQRRNNASARLR